MPPKITHILAWNQAELLMQPSLLRVVDNIRKKLEESSWKETYEEVQIPYPSYLLHLRHQDQQVTINLWELCYQVCFLNYQIPHSQIETQEVEIDLNLIDDTGDVNWDNLEAKTKTIIEQLFANLPAI